MIVPFTPLTASASQKHKIMSSQHQAEQLSTFIFCFSTNKQDQIFTFNNRQSEKFIHISLHRFLIKHLIKAICTLIFLILSKTQQSIPYTSACLLACVWRKLDKNSCFFYLENERFTVYAANADAVAAVFSLLGAQRPEASAYCYIRHHFIS